MSGSSIRRAGIASTARSILTPGGMRPAATGKRFVERALERAGIPALIVDADVVDARRWDRDHMRRVVGRFIDDRVRAKGAV